MAVSLTMNDYGFYEPMKKNWFLLQFTSFPKNLSSNNANEDNLESLTIACKECSVPNLQTGVNELHRINDIVYTPGKSQYSPITARFYEFMKGKNKTNEDSAGYLLKMWQNAIHDPQTGVQGRKADIVTDLAIVQIDAEGNPIRTWSVYNCWPTNVTFDELSSEDGGVLSVSIELKYDWAKINDTDTYTSNENGGGNGGGNTTP